MSFKVQVCIFGTLVVALSQVASKPKKNIGVLDINTRHPGCFNKTFCIIPHPDYPQKQIDYLIKEKHKTRRAAIFKIYVKNLSKLKTCVSCWKTIHRFKLWSLHQFNLNLGDAHNIAFRARLGEPTYDDDDCSKYTYFNKVYEFLDKDSQLRVVVQSPYFNQTISLGECQPPTGHDVRLRSGTIHFDDATLVSHDIYCEQIVLDYKFIVLTIDGNDVEFVSPKNKLPVGCTARVR